MERMTAKSGALQLRTATLDDAYALWIWANDRDTRVGSHGREEIVWASHRDWLSTNLSSADAMLFMAEEEGRPVASIRFHSVDGWKTARLAYVVAPEARGRGVSRPLVREGCARLRAAHPEVAILAEVMKENMRSASVFSGEGWRDESPSSDLHRFWHP